MVHAQQGKVDVTFNTIDDGSIGDGFDNAVRTLSLQGDQNLIVGGDYLNLNGHSSPYLTRLKPDGTIDEDFNIGSGFNGKVYATYIQPDGKIIVGGNFTTYSGVTVGRLVRLNTNGSLDQTFNTSIGATTGIIYEITAQPNGSIIIVGSFTKYNNVTANRIARLLPDGSLDISFMSGSGAPVTINKIKVLSDGKILISGNFTVFNGIQINRMVRLNGNGEVDATFNTGLGFDDDVNAMAVQPDGKIIVGGKFTSYDGIAASRIIRLNKNGTIDDSFLTGSGFSAGAVQAIKVDPSGNIMAAGSFTGNYNGVSVNRVCFLNSIGILKNDIDFGSGPASASVLALENDAEGSWYIGGTFSVFDGLNQGRLAKINSEGEYDTAYLSAGIGFENSVYKILPLENGKAMVMGNFKKFNGTLAPRIARLLEDGSSDASFNTEKSGANNLIKTAANQLDGKIILGGNFTKYNDTDCNRIVRISPDGSVDPTFNFGTGFNSQIYALALQPEGKIIAAGNFTKYNDGAVGRIVRLLPDGQRDTSFNTGLGADAVIEAILIQSDGKIIVAGHFNTFDGNSFPRLVRLNTNGSIDTSFNIGTGFDKYVYALALQSNQKIVIGGSFLMFNGVTQKRILRLNTDGSLDTTFNSGIGFSKGDVRSILVQPDDRILVGGTFSGTYKNVASLRLLRLHKSGDFDESFDARLNNKLLAMTFTSDFRLMIGGDFNSVSGSAKHRIARLKLCLDTTIWDGGSWSKGFPSGGKEVIFKEDYPSLTTANICSCSINEGKKVTLLKENTLGIEFDYSGLGSLILENAAGLYQSDNDIINTGIINLKRDSSPIVKLDYTYWSSPVANQKLLDVSPNTPSDKYFSYDYMVKNWKHESPSNHMIAGKGYIIQGPKTFSSTTSSKYEATFKGIPNNGRVEVSIGGSDSFSLIGNPYPSTLNADIFLKSNAAQIKGTLYFWTHNTPITKGQYASDDYAVYNLLGGVGTRGALASGVNETIPDEKIASGQAFFVSGKTSGTVEFNNMMRMAEKNTTFFKPAKVQNDDAQIKVEKHRIWLNLKNSEGIFKQILLGYIEGASNSYDTDFDAESFNGNQFVDFYSIAENKELVIQGRALPFVESDSVVLGYSSTISGEFNLSIDHLDGLFSNLDVFIEDKNLKSTHNLKDGPYLFQTQKGTYNDRFALKFTNVQLGTDDFEKDKKELLVSVRDKNISVFSTKEFISEVDIFDVSGKRLFVKEKIDARELQISNLQSRNQILLIMTTLKNGYKTTKKILF